MLKVEHLRKEYDRVVAVDDISLEVKRGELFGLLGPNGAGKTTTIRTILNIINPDAGRILFDGEPFRREMWNKIGYLPEERGLYRKSKINSTLLYFASLKGMPVKEAKRQAGYWLERFGLGKEAHRRIEELSKGNQQKVQLIISLVHQPQLLILDEPFSGLDPVNQVLLKDILLDLRKHDTAIIFSTHQMEQVEKMCDTICLINKGRRILGGTLTEIKKTAGTNAVRLEYEGDGAFLSTLPMVRRTDVYQNYAELELTDMTKTSELLTQVNGRLAVRKFEIVEPSLQSIFIAAVGGAEKLEQASGKPIPAVEHADPAGMPGVYKDPRVRRRILVLVLGIAVLAYAGMRFDLAQYLKEFIGFGFVVLALGTGRLLQTVKAVKREALSRGKEDRR